MQIDGLNQNSISQNQNEFIDPNDVGIKPRSHSKLDQLNQVHHIQHKEQRGNSETILNSEFEQQSNELKKRDREDQSRQSNGSKICMEVTGFESIDQHQKQQQYQQDTNENTYDNIIDSVFKEIGGNINNLRLSKFKTLQEFNECLQNITYDQFKKSIYNSSVYKQQFSKYVGHESVQNDVVQEHDDIKLGKRLAVEPTENNQTYDAYNHLESLNTRTLKIFERWATNVPYWEQSFISKITKIHPATDTYNQDLTELVQFNTNEVAMAYVRSCIGQCIQRDSDISFNVVPPLNKIKAWLESNEYKTEIENCILAVGAEFTKQADLCSKEDVERIERNDFGKVLLTQMFNSCYNSPTFQCNTQVVLMMIKHGALRNCVLKWVVLFNAQKLRDQKQPPVPKGITQLIPSLNKVLSVQFNFSANDIAQVNQYPNELLWDDLLLFLRDVESRSQLLKITRLMCDGRLDPTIDVKECNVVLCVKPAVYQFLLKGGKCSSMGFDKVKSLLDRVSTMDAFDSHQALVNYGADKLVERERIQVVASVQVATDEVDLTSTPAQIAAQLKFNCLNEYKAISGIADQFRQNAGGEFLKIGGLILYSARACQAQTKCVYAQLDQGNGKSFGNIQICEYLKYQGYNPIYVTLTKELQSDVENKMQKVKCEDVKVIVYSDLQAHFKQQSTVFVFDEYYSALTQTDLKVIDRKMNPIFELGQTERVVISTGHRSKQFSKFLERYFGNNFIEQQNLSMKTLLGEQQKYNIRSKSFGGIEEAQQAAIQHVKKNCQAMPIICFGLDWENDERFGLGEDSFIKYVSRNQNALENLQLNAPKYSKGVIGLPLEYGTGIDVRFKDNAYVVIVMDTTPQPETVKQMVARGCRNMGDYNGCVFYVGAKDEEDGVQMRLERCDGEDFQDGADLLLCLRKLAANTRIKTPLFTEIVQRIGCEWKISFSDLMKSLSSDQRNLIEEVHSRIQTERQQVIKKQPAKKAKIQKQQD